ncbi:hypothetical protein PIROE2DRAFT_8031 [Piromyces sp. E2]|nr:hypothetical protein PIROE2DRAFT_8031 [Piromyces sp. E2]|eukprot:OUM65054.1 hypothetical protein PIROE2DRAFT_8031 [Piromyces sp. E2]
MDTLKVAGVKRSNSFDLVDDNYNFSKRKKFNNEISQYQIYKMKCSIIHSDLYNLYNDVSDTNNTFYNSNPNNNNIENYYDQTLNNNSDRNQIIIPTTNNDTVEENELTNNNTEYEQINTTLRNLHMHSNIYKNNQIHNIDMIRNNHPIYRDFYIKINSQMKNLHIINMKQHGKEYLE